MKEFDPMNCSQPIEVKPVNIDTITKGMRRKQKEFQSRKRASFNLLSNKPTLIA